jgi:hypothetical protein
MRLLYLKRSLTGTNGRSSMVGYRLFEQFKTLADDTQLGHVVLDPATAKKFTHPRFTGDILTTDTVRRFRPDVIYLEGGLFAYGGLFEGETRWRIPKPFVEELVLSGAIMIVADTDINQFREYKSDYREAAAFFMASATYDRDEEDEPYHLCDPVTRYGITFQTKAMNCSEWLRPVYNGVEAISVELAVALSSLQDILATSDYRSAGLMQRDTFLDLPTLRPFASVAQQGLGYAVLIAGIVSADYLLAKSPGNGTWLTNLATFLLGQSAENRRRSASYLHSPYKLFLSHRSVNKAVVTPVAKAIRQLGADIWYDQEEMLPSDSLVTEISRGLDTMTHFILFWSKDCVGAPWVQRELSVAVSKLVEAQLPIILVRLDQTPVPAILSDLLYVDGTSGDPAGIAEAIVKAVERLAERKKLR